MNPTFTNAMSDLRALNHGDLKDFANLVRARLTHTDAPSTADFIDAIYEAAVELSKDTTPSTPSTPDIPSTPDDEIPF